MNTKRYADAMTDAGIAEISHYNPPIRYYPHVNPREGERYADYHDRARREAEVWQWNATARRWESRGGARLLTKKAEAENRREWRDEFYVIPFAKEPPTKRAPQKGPRYGTKRSMPGSGKKPCATTASATKRYRQAKAERERRAAMERRYS
jgi:hypothetical protein